MTTRRNTTSAAQTQKSNANATKEAEKDAKKAETAAQNKTEDQKATEAAKKAENATQKAEEGKKTAELEKKLKEAQKQIRELQNTAKERPTPEQAETLLKKREEYSNLFVDLGTHLRTLEKINTDVNGNPSENDDVVKFVIFEGNTPNRKTSKSPILKRY